MFYNAEIIHGEFDSEPLLLKSSTESPWTSVVPDQALGEYHKGKACVS